MKWLSALLLLLMTTPASAAVQLTIAGTASGNETLGFNGFTRAFANEPFKITTLLSLDRPSSEGLAIFDAAGGQVPLSIEVYFSQLEMSAAYIWLAAASSVSVDNLDTVYDVETTIALNGFFTIPAGFYGSSQISADGVINFYRLPNDRSTLYAGRTQIDLHAESVTLSAVPEPSSWLLLIAGFGAVGVVLRRGQRPENLRFKGRSARRA